MCSIVRIVSKMADPIDRNHSIELIMIKKKKFRYLMFFVIHTNLKNYEV